MTDTDIPPLRQPSRRALEAQVVLRRIAMAAALGVVLGLAVQALIVIVRLSGGVLPAPAILAEVTQTAVWTGLVCASVAAGMAVGKVRKALAAPVAAVLAPLALYAAKAAQRVMLSVLDAAEQPTVLSLGTVGVIRALEYGLLAWLLTLLAERKERQLWLYLVVGVSVAVVFNGVVLALIWSVQARDGISPQPLMLVTVSISEWFTPVFCALVMYATQMIAANARIWARGAPPKAADGPRP